MINHEKKIKSIEVLAERAERRGEAVLNRDGREVYRVEVNKLSGNKYLYHYGTVTLEMDEYNTINHIYGESVSDADSIGTFLNYFGIEGVYAGFRPVNGGFYVGTYDENYNHTQKTLADHTREYILNFINRL